MPTSGPSRRPTIARSWSRRPSRPSGSRRSIARFRVIALLETAKGVSHADRIAASDNVVALMWGAEDLVASLGGTSSRKPNGRYRDIARYARVADAPRGRRPRQGRDRRRAPRHRRREAPPDRGDGCRRHRLLSDRVHPPEPGRGHPRRLSPGRRNVAWARACSPRRGGAECSRTGRMVDEPVLRHARSVLQRRRLIAQAVSAPRCATISAAMRAMSSSGSGCVREDDESFSARWARPPPRAHRKRGTGRARCASSSPRSAARSARPA